MVKNKLALVASALLCVGAQNAAANEIGFYMGGYLGQSKKEVPRAPLDDFAVAVHEVAFFTPSDVQSSLDDTDTAFAIFGGYRLNRYLGFEAGFTNLGTVTYKSQATGSFPLEAGRVNTTVESETSGFTLSVLGLLPLTRNWELFARGGALFASNQLKFVITAEGQQFIPPIGNRVTDSGSKTTTETYASVGIGRRFLEIYGLRLEYQRVWNAGEEITGAKGDIDAAFLGLTVTF
jgi:hypothetical protein